MSDNTDTPKVNLADAIRKKLEQKKQKSAPGQATSFQAGSAKAFKNQNDKKPANQRRRTGGS
ncbi:hypothetical protein [Paenibacillus sp. CMAA1364]